MRTAPQFIASSPQIEVDMDPPSVDMYFFKGTLTDAKNGKKVELSLKNFVPRGCVLRNTDHILGMVGA
jgi:hypothetical protein